MQAVVSTMQFNDGQIKAKTKKRYESKSNNHLFIKLSLIPLCYFSRISIKGNCSIVAFTRTYKSLGLGENRPNDETKRKTKNTPRFSCPPKVRHDPYHVDIDMYITINNISKVELQLKMSIPLTIQYETYVHALHYLRFRDSIDLLQSIRCRRKWLKSSQFHVFSEAFNIRNCLLHRIGR